jgi:CDP-6-deoxy-D-xylo-4-hexulose-3-dehydrase
MSELIKYPLMSNNITRDDCNKLVDFLNQDPIPRLTNGPQVAAFEKEWGEWLGTEHNIMVNSGSSANELSFLMLRHLIPSLGDVIVPPLCWVSDVASIMQNGFRPIFCDIKKDNLALDIEEVKKKITPETRAILLVHILGYNGLSEELLELCKDKNIILIEDCCESHGATFNGQKVGSFGNISNFSFYFAHHMSSIEGGMISSNKEVYGDLGKIFRSHGMLRESKNEKVKEKITELNDDLNPDFIFLEGAHNHRSTEINAVIARNQLKRLDFNIEKRRKNLDIFLDGLNPEKYYTKFNREGNSNYAFTLLLNKASMVESNQVEQALKKNGIEFRRGMSGGGNQLRQPYLRRYKGLAEAHKKFPVTEFVHDFGWYIGNFPELEEGQIVDLTKVLNEAI